MELKSSKILENIEVCKNYFFMKIAWKNADKFFLPGQFCMLEVSSGLDPILRRPFSIFETDEENFTIAYKKIGKGTNFLSQKRAGDEINLIAGLGNNYLDQNFDFKNYEKILVVGGGTGIASVHFLHSVLKSKNVSHRLLLGARSADDFFCLHKFPKPNENLKIMTDDGTFGEKGFLTDYFGANDLSNSLIFMCAPDIVVKKSFEKLKEKNVKNFRFYASFEEYMACGIGICSGCAIKIKQNNGFIYKNVCKDGAIFDVEEVLWED